MSRHRASWTLLAALGGCVPEGAPAASGLSAPTEHPVAEPWSEHVHFVGRHRRIEPGQVRYGWPGTGFTARFSGTRLEIRLDDQARYHAVIVDGELMKPLETRPGVRSYEVVHGLPKGEHEVTVLRRTEGHLGPTTLLQVSADGPLLPVAEPGARLEVIGDSITAGYGNEGRSRRCRYSPETQNLLRSYAALAARATGAELSAVAWSGKGVVSNYGGDRTEVMPSIYERSVPTEPDSRWDFSVAADVVLVNLGTNDFSTEDDPSAEEFVTGYVELLAHVRRVHGDVPILTTVAPMLGDEERGVAESYIDQAIALRQQAGDGGISRIDLHVDAEGHGCDWHPSAATHEAMAERLEPLLREALR